MSVYKDETWHTANRELFKKVGVREDVQTDSVFADVCNCLQSRKQQHSQHAYMHLSSKSAAAFLSIRRRGRYCSYGSSSLQVH